MSRPRLILLPAGGALVIAKGRTVACLAPQRVRLLLCLMGRPRVSFDVLADAAWPDADTMPDGWWEVLHVQVCRLRRVLAPLGVRIARAGSGPRSYRLIWDGEVN